MQEATKAVKRTGTAGSIAAAMLLTAYCAPLLAATGIDCDRTDALSDPMDLAQPELIVSVTEHGATSPMSEPREEDRLRRPSASTLSLAPQAETILRRIFDESYSATELDELEPASATGAKSIAELTDSTDTVDSAGDDSDDSDVPPLDADLPGMSDDETIRYRRQMFRTDI